MITLKQHLDRIRKLAHKTQEKNGHYKKMSDKGRVAAKKAIKLYWKKWHQSKKDTTLSQS